MYTNSLVSTCGHHMLFLLIGDVDPLSFFVAENLTFSHPLSTILFSAREPLRRFGVMYNRQTLPLQSRCIADVNCHATNMLVTVVTCHIFRSILSLFYLSFSLSHSPPSRRAPFDFSLRTNHEPFSLTIHLSVKCVKCPPTPSLASSSVEGHYRLLSDCNRPDLWLYTRTFKTVGLLAEDLVRCINMQRPGDTLFQSNPNVTSILVFSVKGSLECLLSSNIENTKYAAPHLRSVAFIVECNI